MDVAQDRSSIVGCSFIRVGESEPMYMCSELPRQMSDGTKTDARSAQAGGFESSSRKSFEIVEDNQTRSQKMVKFGFPDPFRTPPG